MKLGIDEPQYLMPMKTSETEQPAAYDNVVKSSCDNCATVRFFDPRIISDDF